MSSLLFDNHVFTSQGRVTVDELLRLQGIEPDWLCSSRLSPSQLGHMGGNAMTAPVLAAVLQEGLKSMSGI